MTAGAAASLWLRTMLAGPPLTVRVVGAGRRAAYLRTAAGDVVAVESPAGVRLPNALALDGRAGSPADLPVGARGTIGGGALRVAAHTVTVRRWWDPTPRLGRPDAGTLARRRPLHDVSGPEGTAPGANGHGGAVRRLATAAAAWQVGLVPTAVADLIGRGPGSTPAGDDVLAGVLATVRALADAAGPDGVAFADALAHHARRLAHRTTALSATLLSCADGGAMAAPAVRVLRAAAGYGAWAPAVAGLQAVGHTSGRDLLTGIAIGLDAVAGRSHA